MSKTWWKLLEAEFFFENLTQFNKTENDEDSVIKTTETFVGEGADQIESFDTMFSQFIFYLSAFLSAYRSITAVMQKEYKKAEGFRDWYYGNGKTQDEMKKDGKMRLLKLSRDVSLHQRVVWVCPVMHLKADHQSRMTCDVRWFFEENITDNPEITKIADIENIIKNDIITICQECMEKMKQIVLECERRFSH
jgi:hypothetical protein